MTEADARDLAERVMHELPAATVHVEKLSRPEATDLEDYVVTLTNPETEEWETLDSQQEWETYVRTHPLHFRTP